MVRKLLKGLGYIGLALVVLGFVAYLARDPLRDALARSLSAALSKAMHGSLHIGKLRGSLVTSLLLQDVVIRDAQDVVLQLDEVRLVYHPMALLTGRLIVSLVDVVRPRVTLTQDANGVWNVSRLFPSAPTEEPAPEAAGGLPFEVVLARVQLRDGQLALRTEALPGVQRVDGIQIRLHGRLQPEGLHVELQQVSARATPAEVDIQTLRGVVEGPFHNLRVDDLRLQTGGSLVTVTGALPGGTQRASLAVRLQPLDMTEIGRLLGNDALQGPVTLTLRADGPPEALQVQTQLEAQGGQLDLQSAINLAATPVQYRGNLQLSHLDLAALVGRATFQSDLNLRLHVAGQGLVPGAIRGQVDLDIQPSQVGGVVIQPSRVELEAHAQRVVVKQGHIDTSVAQLTANGAVDLQGTSQLHYALEADLAKLRPLVSLEALAGTIEARGRLFGKLTAIQGDGVLQAHALRYQNNRLTDLRLTYEGRDLGAQPQATVQLHLQGAQAGELPIEQVTLQATYEGTNRQVRFTGDVRQSPTYTGKISGSLRLEDAGQHLVLDTLQVGLAERLWTAQEPIHLDVTSGRIAVTGFRLAHDQESVQLSGALEGQTFRRLHLQVRDLEIAALRDVIQLPEVLYGRASLQVQLDGTMPQPILQSELRFRPNLSEALAAQRVHLTLAYADKQVQSAVRVQQEQRETLAIHLTLPADLAMMALPLAQRLRDAPVRIRAEVQRPDLRTIGAWVPGLPELSGTLQGHLDLQGTYMALDLGSDLRAQDVGVRGVIERVNGALQMTANLVTAPSLAALAQALSQGQPAPKVENLVVRLPALTGTLPAPPGGVAQPIRLAEVVLDAQAERRQEGLSATLNTLRAQVEAFALPPATFTLSGRLTPEQVELTRLHARLPQSEVRLSGTLSRSSEQVQLRMEIPRFRLDEIVRSLPPTVPREVRGTVQVQGTVPAPTVDARLSIAGADLHTTIATRWRDEIPTYRARLQITGLQTAEWLPNAAGILHLTLQLQGAGFTAEQRQARLVAKVESERFSLAPELTVDLRAQVTGETVQVEQLRLRSVPAAFEAQGTLSATQPFRLTYGLTLQDLQSVRQALGLHLEATGRLDGTLSGTVETLQTQGEIKLDTWRVGDFLGNDVWMAFAGHHLTTAPQATLRAQMQGVQGPSIPASAVQLEGNFQAPQGQFKVAVTAGPYENTGLDGEVRLQDGQHVTLHHLRLQGRGLAWENGQPIHIVRDPQGTLRLSDLWLRHEEEEIRIHGMLSPSRDVAASAQIQRLRLQPILQALRPDASLPAGTVAADIELQGSLRQPQLTGTLALSALQWQKQRLGDIHVTLGPAGERVRTDILWQDQNQELLRLQGTVGLLSPVALTIQAQSSGFDLKRLQGLHPELVHSAGRLNLDLRLDGTLEQPQVDGTVRLHDGELQLVTTGERYKDIQIELLFAGQRTQIERFDVASRSGGLRLAGWLERAGFALRQLDLSVQADQFTPVHTSQVEAVVTAALTARGSPEEMRVKGNVTVPRARYRLSGQLGGGPSDVEPWQLTVAGVYGPGQEAVESPTGTDQTGHSQVPLPFLQADVTLDIPKNAWVQRSGMAVEVRGQLHVTKALQEPFILDGSVETVRGFATFYGKKFTLQEGKVTFAGTPEINPYLDVVVNHTVSDYIVTIAVGGRAQEPKLDFRSEPELPQADIVSLLVTGKTTDRLTVSEQKSLSDRGGQVLGGVAAGQLQNILGEPLGLDTVEVEAGDKLGTGRIGVGRYVTQDIFMSYEREVGDEGGNTVGIEYSINRHLKLKGSTSDVGETAIDLFWRLDY